MKQAYKIFTKKLAPYVQLARFDKPIGFWLLAIPCWWSLAFALQGPADLILFPLFFAGAVVMRAAGCIFNDIVDRDLDQKVARTKTRPLASGALKMYQAVVLLVIMLLLGLVILLQLNTLTIVLGLLSLGPVVIYPFMKRFTHWPQAFLGLTFNWGALLGGTSITGALSVSSLVLYAACIFWTLGYDTIYAHQDKEDDLLAGIKSTALKLGGASKLWIAGFYGVFFGLFAVVGYASHMNTAFYAVMLIGVFFAGSRLRLVDLNNPKSCLAAFKSNQNLGLILLTGIFLGEL